MAGRWLFVVDCGDGGKLNYRHSTNNSSLAGSVRPLVTPELFPQVVYPVAPIFGSVVTVALLLYVVGMVHILQTLLVPAAVCFFSHLVELGHKQICTRQRMTITIEMFELVVQVASQFFQVALPIY